jgi:predicted Zn-dependent protease
MSQTAHRPRPLSPAATAALALLAALITGWLGLVAHFGAAAVADDASAVPEQLAVVRVQSGESLQDLAARVAPGTPTGRVADRIREINGLDSVALEAGQTLIAPIG